MEEGLTKKLKGSDGLPIPVGCDNPQSDVPQSFHDGAAAEFVRNQFRIETKSVDYYSSEPKGLRSYKLFSFNDGSESDIDGLTDGSIGNAVADKSQRNNGADSKQTSVVQVNSSIEGKANEISTDVSESDNAMPLVNFSGYVGSQHKKAGDTAACVASSGVGIPSDVFGLDERQLKRERRKQANRESARKSRLRKQAEYEGLVKWWESLNMENVALKCELEQLKGDSEQLRLENTALMEKLEVRGVSQKGEMVSSNVEADLTLTNKPEKVPNDSDTLNRNVNPDRNTRESSNSETKLHQLLESSSRADTVAAR